MYKHQVALGSFISHKDAVAHLCQHLGVQKSALKKRVHRPGPWKYKLKHLLIPIFQNGLPGDLSFAYIHATDSSSMVSALPVLEFVSIMSMYRHCKDLLLQAWESMGQEAQQQKQVLRHALGIIKQACTEYAKLSSEIIDPWTEHCSRNVPPPPT